MEAKRTTSSLYENVALARQIIRDEALSLQRLSTRLPADFSQAVITLVECQGAALVTGIGKAGWIGQKLSATLASTGTRSHFVHPGEAMHGDLGRVGPDDVLIVLSNSGETEEILRMLPSAESLSASVIAITATTTNTLAQRATLVLDYGQTHEACPNGLAPTTTTTTMLALGNATALVFDIRTDFGQDQGVGLRPPPKQQQNQARC